MFVLAILFAYLLSPLVNLVDRFVARGRSRTYSLAAVYVVLVVLLVAGVIFIGNKVAEEAANLAAGFPGLLAPSEQKLASPDPAWLQPVKHYVLAQIDSAGRVSAQSLDVIQRVGWRVVAALSNLVYLVLIPILSFFFLKDGRKLTDQALALGSGRRRAMWEDILSDLNVLLGQFMRALVILSLATFTFYSTFFAIIGLPYAVLLASVAAVLEFIPLVGPLTAAAIILLSAAFSGAGHILVILVFLIAYRFLSDYDSKPPPDVLGDRAASAAGDLWSAGGRGTGWNSGHVPLRAGAGRAAGALHPRSQGAGYPGVPRIVIAACAARARCWREWCGERSASRRRRPGPPETW